MIYRAVSFNIRRKILFVHFHWVCCEAKYTFHSTECHNHNQLYLVNLVVEQSLWPSCLVTPAVELLQKNEKHWSANPLAGSLSSWFLTGFLAPCWLHGTLLAPWLHGMLLAWPHGTLLAPWLHDTLLAPWLHGTFLAPCIRCQIAGLWYICMLVVLNTTKYIIMTDVTAILNLEEFHQQFQRHFCRWCNNDINLWPAVALARSSIHPPTMDLVCNGPSTVRSDAFNLPLTLYVLYTLCISTFVWLSHHWSLRLHVLCPHNHQLIILYLE